MEATLQIETKTAENRFMEKDCDGNMVDRRVCPYCGKTKRGWRRSECGILCAQCDKELNYAEGR